MSHSRASPGWPTDLAKAIMEPSHHRAACASEQASLHQPPPPHPGNRRGWQARERRQSQLALRTLLPLSPGPGPECGPTTTSLPSPPERLMARSRRPLSPSSRTQGQPRPHGRFSGRHGPRPLPPPRSDTSRASSQDSRPLKGGRTSSRPALLSPFPPGIPAQASLPSSQLALEAMGQLAPPQAAGSQCPPTPTPPAGPCCDAPGGPQLLWGRLCPRALSSETSWGGVAALQPQPHSAPPPCPSSDAAKWHAGPWAHP